MIPKALLQELKRIVGERHLSESRAVAELYSYDGSLARGASGAVIFPADAGETARVVAAAGRADVPLVARGFGTNLSGGTVLTRPGLTLCLSRMNRILEISPRSRTAVVQPGVTNLELQNALSPLGFFYAPDPASQKVSTLGGNVGENSGGPRCVKYGVTTNHVLGLEVVLPSGERLRLGGAPWDPPGCDLRGLLIGSEGTLAVVTEATVRILPKPEKVITQLVVYDEIAAAARSVADIIAAGIVPAALEMMDAPIIRAVEESIACGYPRDAAAVLIIEVEGPEAGLEDQARRVRAICAANRCRDVRCAATAEERNRLWEGRRGAFGAVARLAPNYLVNDCTVPRTLLPEALERVADIAGRHGFEHGNVFHAGDGNLHPLILFDSRDPGQLDRVHAAGWEIMLACVALGGTISGEHGIGLEKMEAMRLVFSDEEIEAQRSLKDAFDPDRILNPGKLFPDTGKPFAFRDQAAWTRPPDPLSAAESGLAERVRQAHAAGRALRPTGGNTSRGFGNELLGAWQSIPTDALDSLAELDPPNQVATAGAGLRLGALQAALAPYNQWLPLRPALGLLQRSMGGIAATNACGPERAAYGSPRRLLLGMRFIDGRGRLISAGGKVMKNVAGYDLTRLMAGSAGTLGLITRVTLKTATRPERCASISACGRPEACDELAASVMGSSLGAVSAAAVPENGTGRWRLEIGFEGFAETVAAQLKRAGRLFEQAGFSSVRVADYDLLTGPFAALYGRIAGCPFALRAGAPPGQIGRAAALLGSQLQAEPMLVDFGCGRVLAGGGDLSEGGWREIVARLGALGGQAVLENAPDAFKHESDVFGGPRPDWKLMHRVKGVLDPARIFSRGAMPGRV
ncbi:MAG: FAD-linked oxidase C-terminal domain-containing protein [Desulfobacterales bacterium]